MDKALKNKIEEIIKSKKVFLFMKGTPAAPECGFSMKVTEILKKLKVDFGYFNIFDDEEIRQGIKEYADWPTIPQLYINGEFIGGCDIAVQLFESGELQKMLGK